MRRWTRCTVWLALALPLLSAQNALAQPPPPPPVLPAEDDDAADDAAGGEDDEPDPARKPPQGKGAVWGVITDAANKEPVIDASVTVVGTKYKAIADIDGRFRLELPPGNYELRVWYELYRARRVQNLRVTAGRVERVDVRLDLDKAAEEEIEIELDPVRASAAAQLAIRKNAPTVGDAVSAQEIAKSPDRNAADAARRVVGASVVGNKYVYVRGLGERYTNSLLNGVPLPSPEPDKQAVPLDLFPSLILSDLTITKTFTPDMPGDFAGGSVRINTRDLPEKFLLQGTLSVGFNTASTFRDRLTYRGSSTDWLGIDSGTRALPADIPDNYKLARLEKKPDGTFVANDELVFRGRQINAYMTTQRTINPPHLSGNVVVGDTLKFGVNQRLGYSVALTYGRKFSTRGDETLNNYNPAPNTPTGLAGENTYRSERGVDSVSWGGFVGLAYHPTRGQKISLTGLHSRSSENEARFIEGYYREKTTDIQNTRLKFVSRSLSFGQLAGEHKLPLWNKPTLDWNLSLSLATADEPDTRETVYTKDATTGVYFFENNTQSGSHLWSEQQETAVSGGVDLSQPLRPGDAGTTVKLGSLFSLRSRSFDIRRFRFAPSSAANLEQPPDQLFGPTQIGTTMNLEEYTRENDAYLADQRLFAGYLMTDTWLVPRLRVILGGRVEASSQSIDSFNRFLPEKLVRSELNTVDLLPSANVVLKTTDKSNLRLSVSRTVARPQLRELSPTLYIEYFGARETYGNPNLKRTTIYNGDVRFEYFPTPAEVLAISIFYKQFYDPIEQIILTSTKGITSFDNAKLARNAGAELEARKGLGWIHPVLADLTVLGNVTFVYSRVELNAQAAQAQTNDTRPLAGQSPFVVNAGIDYANEKSGTRARLLYNVFGSRIHTVGTNGLPDEYERPRHQVDATVAQKLGSHFDVKLAVENILNAPTVFTHGDGDILDENTTERYHTGATFTLSGTYTY